jgi:hypothetical protein
MLPSDTTYFGLPTDKWIRTVSCFNCRMARWRAESHLRWLVSCHSIGRFGNGACHCQPSTFQSAHKTGRKKSQCLCFVSRWNVQKIIADVCKIS